MLALLLLVLVQQIPGPPGDDPAPTPAAAECVRGAEEIVVCAGDPDAYRIKREERQAAGPPKARTRISPNKTISLRAENAPLDTAPVTRAMINLKIDF